MKVKIHLSQEKEFLRDQPRRMLTTNSWVKNVMKRVKVKKLVRLEQKNLRVIKVIILTQVIELSALSVYARIKSLKIVSQMRKMMKKRITEMSLVLMNRKMWKTLKKKKQMNLKGSLRVKYQKLKHKYLKEIQRN